MVATFNEQMQSQTDQILRIFQGLQELQVSTSLRPTVEESIDRLDELRLHLTNDFQTKIDMVRSDCHKDVNDCQKVVHQNLDANREDSLEDQLAMMRNKLIFFKFIAKAQLKQNTPDSECCCFKFLKRFKTNAVTQPQPDFIAEHEQLIEDLARKFCQGAEGGKGSFREEWKGASLSGKGGGKSGGDGPASPGNIFGGMTGGDHGTL